MNKDEAEDIARQHLSAAIRLESCEYPDPSYTAISSNKDDFYCFNIVTANIGATECIAVHKETGEVENLGLFGE